LLGDQGEEEEKNGWKEIKDKTTRRQTTGKEDDSPPSSKAQVPAKRLCPKTLCRGDRRDGPKIDLCLSFCLFTSFVVSWKQEKDVQTPSQTFLFVILGPNCPAVAPGNSEDGE